MRNEFAAVIEPSSKGDPSFIAHCPEIPGANGQGKRKTKRNVTWLTALPSCWSRVVRKG